MCHHATDRWISDRENELEEDTETDDAPSFIQRDRDVDVDLLEADDD